MLPFEKLTDREKQILEKIAQGQSNPQIARHFGISPHTVHNHTKNIFKKLGITNRVSASTLYWQHMWTSPTTKK